MASTDKVRVESRKPGVGKLDVDTEKNFFYNDTTTVSIVSLVDAIVKVTGAVTGNVYIWPHAGAEVEVDILDKDEILNKKRGRSCCGGISGTPLFQLA